MYVDTFWGVALDGGIAVVALDGVHVKCSLFLLLLCICEALCRIGSEFCC